jgi:hypothetical protein
VNWNVAFPEAMNKARDAYWRVCAVFFSAARGAWKISSTLTEMP